MEANTIFKKTISSIRRFKWYSRKNHAYICNSLLETKSFQHKFLMEDGPERLCPLDRFIFELENGDKKKKKLEKKLELETIALTGK